MYAFVREHVRAVAAVLTLCSLALIFGAVGGVVPRGAIPRVPALVALVPHLNAAISLVAIAVILLGVRWIRRGQVRHHRRAMLAALALFAAFLVLYLYRVSVHGPTEFGGPQVVYTYLYLPVLAVHMLLAMGCIPLLYYVLLLGLTRPPSAIPDTPHPRVGRVAATLWLVSFALGVVVYLLLYVVF